MRLRLFLAKSLSYSSDNWQVVGKKVHLPSITPTTIPNIGYGGFGWSIRVACIVSVKDLQVALFKQDVLINVYALDDKGYCTLIPDGGSIDDYQIIIYPTSKIDEHKTA